MYFLSYSPYLYFSRSLWGRSFRGWSNGLIFCRSCLRVRFMGGFWISEFIKLFMFYIVINRV